MSLFGSGSASESRRFTFEQIDHAQSHLSFVQTANCHIQAMQLSLCCRTTPLPRSPNYTPDAASAEVDTPEYQPFFTHLSTTRPGPDYTIYTRTRQQDVARIQRTERLRAMIADGIGPFDQCNIIVVPNHLPPARVREPDFPFSIFTRTRARMRRTEEHGSFPICHFQSNAPFSKRQRRS